MQTALYSRVSTVDQSCEMQLRELRDYAAKRGWAFFGEYVDTGWSGAKANRPEFDRLMHDAGQRKIDVILCWKLDRFGRSLLHCKAALQELQAHGVRFIATSQSIDTDESNPASRFLLHILMAAAEFERELIRSRTGEGRERAKARGVILGRKPKLTGHQRREAIARRDAGEVLTDIARSYNVSHSTISRLS